MNLKTALGIGAVTLLSFLAPALAKAEAKIDAAYSFINRPKIEYAMRGARIGFYDENSFFGGEQQQIETKGETQIRNLAGARVPVDLGGHLLRAEIMGSQEAEQNTFGVRLRYFFDENHSLGPIVESLAKKTENNTLYGIQGHVEWRGIRTEGGVYNLITPKETKILVNGVTNFTALDHRFGLAWKLSEEQQWYGLVAVNLKGNFGYHLKFTYEPTAGKASQRIVLADSPMVAPFAYYPLSPLYGGDSMVDIIPEYPDSPGSVAGVDEFYVPVYFPMQKKAALWINHLSDQRANTERLEVEGAIYPFAMLQEDNFFRNLFVGAKWVQSRAGNETETSTSGYIGLIKGPFRFVVQQEEGKKGETVGYVMWSQQF